MIESAFHNREESRKHSAEQSRLEAELLDKMEKGTIKAGSTEWREYCQAIEKAHDLSIQYKDLHEMNT